VRHCNDSVGSYVDSVWYCDDSVGSYVDNVWYFDNLVGSYVDSVWYCDDSLGSYVDSVPYCNDSVGSYVEFITTALCGICCLIPTLHCVVLEVLLYCLFEGGKVAFFSKLASEGLNRE
jgi:hypothetical protein